MHAEQKTLFDTGYQTYLGLRRREVTRAADQVQSAERR